ncbi:HupE/UreJ family protein [Roseobacter litoralis]|uniref:HupE/UreJ family protein n=1 Tax=Roseobacter litoralis TaxID=42443 RepID=UPI0024918EC4|nr:HupE/UreJ family protein [Roseobacter litoralis]
MVTSFVNAVSKLCLFLLVSTLFWGGQVKQSAAHEVVPTIADMTLAENGQLVFDFRINIEAFLAGIDLDAVEDTDEDSAASDYDALRALPNHDISARAQEIIDSWNALPFLTTDGASPLTLGTITMPEDVDFELPRISQMQVSAQLPPETASVTVNWPAGSGALVLRQQGVEAPYTGYLDGGQSSEPIALAGGDAQSPTTAFMSYIPVGFDHILPKGLDHILFVLGLFFLSTRWGPLLWQVSAFTLAHTVTLALGAMGWVNVPGSIVEPLIAASIVYVAVENLFQRGLTKWRPFIIFGFGLLHGLGFASVLGEFGLPESQFIPALIGFNVGVELGQLTVIALAALILFGCTRLARRSDLSEAEQPVGTYAVMFRAVSIPASLIIAVIGAYWCVERVFL